MYIFIKHSSMTHHIQPKVDFIPSNEVYHQITNSYKIDQYLKLTALFISIFHLYIKCILHMFIIYIIGKIWKF